MLSGNSNKYAYYLMSPYYYLYLFALPFRTPTARKRHNFLPLKGKKTYNHSNEDKAQSEAQDHHRAALGGIIGNGTADIEKLARNGSMQRSLASHTRIPPLDVHSMH